jgi:PAS domain S-box-containing protein
MPDDLMNEPIRVVLLEDVSTDAELIVRELHRDGLDANVVHAANRGAYERVLSEVKPDIILSDFSLPDMNGLEAFELAHALHPTVPFIVVTASIDESTAVRCMKQGVTDYVLKEHLVRLGPAVRAALELRDRKIANIRAEQALQEREALLQAILRSIPSRIAVLNGKGEIVSSNHAWRRYAAATLVTGTSDDQVGQNYLAVLASSPDISEVPPIDANAVRDVLEGRRNFFEQEYLVAGPSGSSAWYQMTVSPMDSHDGGCIVCHHEITTLRLAEEQVRILGSRYRHFFEDDISANVMTTTDGKIVDCNPAFLSMYEIDGLDTAKATDFNDLFADAADWYEIVRQLEKRQRLHHHRLQVRTAKDKELSVIGNFSGSYDANETLTEIRGFLIDETALRELEGQFLQAQKMEAIGQLAGGIAHDFNNLLSAILGYADLSISTLGEDHPVSEDLVIIRKAGERAAALTRQLLAFSRRQVLQPVVLDVNVAIQELEKMLRRLIGENIDFVTVLAEKLGKVKVDPGQLEQVVINLAVNARDAMPDGGRFTIETTDVDLGLHYARENLNVLPGPYVAISISDSGCGMDEATKARIFEPFFTTKPEGKGTGLGLSTVYGIVKQSGGNVTVYSELGKGTTFKVYLPRIDEDALRSSKSSALPTPVRGDETILLVEDDEGVRTLTKRILLEQGYTVLESRTGDGGIRIAEQYPHAIHLLLTDIVVPGVSGTQVAESIRQLRPEIRVVYMSGYTGTAALFQGPVGRDASFIQKPFTPESLCRLVRRALDTPPQDSPPAPGE